MFCFGYFRLFACGIEVGSTPRHVRLISHFRPFQFCFQKDRCSSSYVRSNFAQLCFRTTRVSMSVNVPLYIRPTNRPKVVATIMPFVIQGGPRDLLFKRTTSNKDKVRFLRWVTCVIYVFRRRVGVNLRICRLSNANNVEAFFHRLITRSFNSPTSMVDRVTLLFPILLIPIYQRRFILRQRNANRNRNIPFFTISTWWSFQYTTRPNSKDENIT